MYCQWSSVKSSLPHPLLSKPQELSYSGLFCFSVFCNFFRLYLVVVIVAVVVVLLLLSFHRHWAIVSVGLAYIPTKGLSSLVFSFVFFKDHLNYERGHNAAQFSDKLRTQTYTGCVLYISCAVYISCICSKFGVGATLSKMCYPLQSQACSAASSICT